MSEVFSVRVCGNKVSVTDPKPYTTGERQIIEEQIMILNNMITLLEVRGIIRALLKEGKPAYEDKLVELTGKSSFEEAEAAATPEQFAEADEYSIDTAVAKAFPGQSVDAVLTDLEQKLASLDGFVMDSYKGKGTAYALKAMLNGIFGYINALSARFTDSTLSMLRGCDTKWNDKDALALKIDNVIEVKEGLEELLKFKGQTFKLASDARSTLAEEAKGEPYKPTTEDNWREWMDSRPWFPDIRLSVGGTMDMVQYDELAVAKKQAGETASGDQPTGTVDWSAQLEWNQLYSGEHQLTISPYYVGRTRGLGGEKATEHKAGLMAEAQNLNPEDYIPSGSLTLEYNENSSAVPNFPHPNEENFRAWAGLNEHVFGPVSLDVADTLTLGKRNDFSHMRNILSAGARLTGRRASLGLGYRSLYLKQDTGINVSVEGETLPSWRSGEQTNKGDGFYAELDAYGPHNAFSLSGYADFMDGLENEGGVSLYYSPYLDWGSPYVTANFLQENLNNGTNRTFWGDLGVNLDVIPFVALRPHVYAGYQMFEYRENSGMRDAEGLVGGGGLEITAKTKKNEPEVAEKVYKLNNSANGGDPLARKARAASKNDTAMVYDDPLVRALITREPSAFAVASYLIAFKAGKLNADYTFDGYYADLEDQAVRVDKAGASYGGDNDGVGVGDVAPVEFYVGGETSSNSNLSSTFYYPTLHRMTPEKRNVLDIAFARHELATGKNKIAVKLPDKATVMAKDLLEALTVIYSDDSETFAASKELKAELKALVVGNAVMETVKVVLKKVMKDQKNAALSTAEINKIDNLTALGRDLVDVITAYAYDETYESGHDLPSYEELCGMLGLTPGAKDEEPAGEELDVVPN